MADILYRGIDVSYANGRIDWALMKGKTDFVIIRLGFGGDYTSQDDVQFMNNVRGCIDNNIPFGVYLYSYATMVAKAENEAQHALRLLRGIVPDLPVFYDLEESRISSLGREKILAMAKAFCKKIENAGYVYGTYANKNWFTDYLVDEWYDTKVKWIAQYYSSVTYNGRYDIWQYTSSGSIDGFSGNFDLNYCYISILRGDVDNDGKITAADARTVLRTSAKIEALSGQNKLNADMNKDGIITAADAREVLRKSAGLG